MDTVPTVVDIKRFFDTGAAKPVTMSEMQEFWKTLTEEEKASYRTAVKNWDGKSFYC